MRTYKLIIAAALFAYAGSISANDELEEFFTFRQIRGSELKFEVDNKTSEFIIQQNDPETENVFSDLLFNRFPYKSHVVITDSRRLARFNAGSVNFKVVQSGSVITASGDYQSMSVTKSFTMAEGPLENGGKNVVQMTITLKNNEEAARKMGIKIVFNAGPVIGDSGTTDGIKKVKRGIDAKGEKIPEFAGLYSKDGKVALAVLFRGFGATEPSAVRMGPYNSLNSDFWDLGSPYGSKPLSTGSSTIAVYYTGNVEPDQSMEVVVFVGGIGSGILELPQIREAKRKLEERKRIEEEKRKAEEERKRIEEEKRRAEEERQKKELIAKKTEAMNKTLDHLRELQQAVEKKDMIKTALYMKELKDAEAMPEVIDYYTKILEATKLFEESKTITATHPRYTEYLNASANANQQYRQKNYTGTVKAILKMLEIGPNDSKTHRYMIKNAKSLTPALQEQLDSILLRRAGEARDKGDFIAAQGICALMMAVNPTYKEDERMEIMSNSPVFPEGYDNAETNLKYFEMLKKYYEEKIEQAAGSFTGSSSSGSISSDSMENF